jgi:DNA-binding MarR family transcriptional regulator
LLLWFATEVIALANIAALWYLQMQIDVIDEVTRMDSEKDAVVRAWSHLLGAQALALRAIEKRLAAAGQPPLAWYDVLLELERAGGELRVGELGERLVIEPHNVTRLVDRLEAKGLLKRRRAAEDQRGVTVVLTRKGAALREAMWPAYRAAIRETFGAELSPRAAETLTALLKGIVGHLRDEA